MSHQEGPEDPLPNELHCASCGRFLLLYDVTLGQVQAKCRKCGRWTLLEAENGRASSAPAT